MTYVRYILCLILLVGCGVDPESKLEDTNPPRDLGPVCTLQGCVPSRVIIKREDDRKLPAGNYQIRWAVAGSSGTCELSYFGGKLTSTGNCEAINLIRDVETELKEFSVILPEEEIAGYVRIQVRKEGIIIADEEPNLIYSEFQLDRLERKTEDSCPICLIAQSDPILLNL